MLTIVLFALLLFAVAGFAGLRGGAPERVAAAANVLAFMATVLTPLLPGYGYDHLNLPLLAVDLTLLLVLVGLAAFADRYWPIWLAAFQLVDVAAHAVRVYNAVLAPGAYWWLTSKMAYPMLALLVAGTWRHRARRAAGLPEFGWTWQRHRHAGERP